LTTGAWMWNHKQAAYIHYH